MSHDADHKLIAFSGGRSSAYMLYRELDKHNGDLPNNYHVCFANTGKELNETLDFVRDCGDRWGVPIVWLEYRYDAEARGGRSDPKNKYEVVDYDSASRNGEPFEQLIYKSNMLPNAARRFCTQELKVETMNRYMQREHDLWTYVQLIGIRYDEMQRASRLRQQGKMIELPLWRDKVTNDDVLNFWKSQKFDLKIDSNFGNCDLCFLKAKNILIDIIRRRPNRADWWIKQEETLTEKVRELKDDPNYAPTTFTRGRSYIQLVDMSKLNALFTDEQAGIDCFCGD